MPDHIKLAGPVQLVGKRNEGSPIKVDPNFSRGRQAETIAGILAGLEQGGRKLFQLDRDAAAEAQEETEMGTFVLKFTTKGAPKKGPFKGLNMSSLGENDDNEFYVLSDADSRRLLSSLVETYEKYAVETAMAEAALAPGGKLKNPPAWAALLDQVRGVEIYGESDRIDPSVSQNKFDPVAILDIILWPTSILSDRPAAAEAKKRLADIQAIIDNVAANNPAIRVLKSDPRPDTLSVSVQADEVLFRTLLRNPYVQKIRGRLKAPVFPSDLVQAANRSTPPLPRGEAIGVVDDLVITANPWLRNVVTRNASFPQNYVFGPASNHGAAVASVAAYGSFSQAVKGQLAPTPFPIYAARVAESYGGAPRVVENVVSQFEEALTWLHSEGVRIAVISLAYAHADNDALPTELAVTVDRLARELNMVVVVSAGNVLSIGKQHHWLDSYPKYLSGQDARVASPGTAANALTVGGVATRADATDPTLTAIAAAGKLSPFSRVGPTRGNRHGKTLKPELTGPGGNWGWREGDVAPVANDPSLGVVTLSASNTPLFSVTTGTSVAAPYVAHQVAKLATRYPDASANLLRALTALSTPRLEPDSLPGLPPSISSAYGTPNASTILESGGNRAILVFEGEITPGSRQVHELPIPDEFVAQAVGADRELRVVLAFDPPVKRSRRHYVAGRMKFDFVRNMTLEQIQEVWQKQPTAAEQQENPLLKPHDLPNDNRRPTLFPKVTKVSSNTLVRRDFVDSSWDVDDQTYFLVISHDTSPWTDSQLRNYSSQKYALAVEIVDVGRTSLDVHGYTLLRQRDLLARTRARARQ